jgi:phosphoribosylanthranilate isomerase
LVTRVKICGITNLRDAMVAVECGAHALGFVMEPTSPRYLADMGHLEAILAELPPYVFTVAVFGPPRNVEVPSGIHAIQCAGTMASSPVRGVKSVYTLRMKPEDLQVDAVGHLCLGADAVLFDSYDPNSYGGTGRLSDWAKAAEIRERLQPKPLILAGGLTPENVGEAIAAVRPFAVDVGSGVEAAPGEKDHAKLRRFIDAVRKADTPSSR